MDAADIEHACPDEGWTAEMVVAHVTLNNDHWTNAGRDLLSDGISAYDNETALALREGAG